MASPHRALRAHRLMLLAALAGGAVAAPASALADDPAPRPDAVLEWFDVTADTVAFAAAPAQQAIPSQAVNSRTWAIAWTAAERALDRVGDGSGRSRDAGDAAVARAVHDVLVALVPGRKAQVDAALQATLDRIGPGPARARGERAGAKAAAAALADRVGDGLDYASVNALVPFPSPAVGVWRPVPPNPATRAPVQPSLGAARSFILWPNSRFRPGPPPAVGSAAYAADLAEVRGLGQDTSTSRSPEQTSLARFWAQTSLNGFTQVLRGVIAAERGSAEHRAHIVSVFHQVTADAQIATYEAKYHYFNWRPITAIREAPSGADPAWAPLITTPQHPEYPSGHTTYAGAAAEVLARLVGNRPKTPITVSSPTAPGVVRTYTAWSTLVQENVDARVWSGIHYRTSDVVGAAVGRKVADWDLDRIEDED